mmetsp:Transcript_80478/g.195110  ORF Transcript_80478/g.195110 Transcript_80478/m.195110 type:complete len:200 (-) Transcript_80478:131-730(-)
MATNTSHGPRNRFGWPRGPKFLSIASGGRVVLLRHRQERNERPETLWRTGGGCHTADRERHPPTHLPCIHIGSTLPRRMPVRDSTRDRELIVWVYILLVNGWPAPFRHAPVQPRDPGRGSVSPVPTYTPWLPTLVMVQEIGLAGHGVRSFSRSQAAGAWFCCATDRSATNALRRCGVPGGGAIQRTESDTRRLTSPVYT